MFLLDLRDELTTRIAIADDRPADRRPGDGMKSVRISIGGWRVAEAALRRSGAEGWKSNLIAAHPGRRLLAGPPRRQAGHGQRRADRHAVPASRARRMLRSRSGSTPTELPGHDPDSGIPTRMVAARIWRLQPERCHATAPRSAATPVAGAVRRHDRDPLQLHRHRRAPGPARLLYGEPRLGTPCRTRSPCHSARVRRTRPPATRSTTDAATRSSLTVPAGPRRSAGRRGGDGSFRREAGPPAVPAGSRIGLGIYFQGAAAQVVDGVALPEQTEFAGYDYRLADVKTATGPSERVSDQHPGGPAVPGRLRQARRSGLEPGRGDPDASASGTAGSVASPAAGGLGIAGTGRQPVPPSTPR